VTAADAVRVAWQATSRRRLRTLLTAASLTVGVLTLVVVQSAQSLVQQATLHRAILRNGPAATLRVQLSPQAGPEPAAVQDWWAARIGRFTAGAALSRYDDYSSVDLTAAGAGTVAVELLSADPALTMIRPFPVVAGAWFTGAALAPRAVLNRSAALTLAPLRAPYWLQAPDGARLHVAIIGVVDDGDPTPDAYVERSAEPVLSAAGLSPVARSILVSSADLSADLLSGRLATVARLTGRSGEIDTVSRIDTVDDYAAELALQRRVFLGIAVLCLLVGSLGILNIGLSALRERTEELSLRRALGASRSAIVAVMMLESQIVALAAAAFAVGAAYAAVPWFMRHLTTAATASGPPLEALLWGVFASATAALAGAVAPSIRAARVPIANLLR
jgi:putative ABC transport system permease protein